MVLPDNVNPQSSILYLASFVLKQLKSGKSYSVGSLYEAVNSNHQMSMREYLFCLDWLYLIGAAVAGPDGEIKLCS